MNPGEILDGRYEIVARLGAGGMGEVYKATHTFLGSPRVIKVVHPQIATNTDAKERFLREARIATKIQHPNVATLHDFASLPDGSHYMVWEFIEGENLAQRLRTRGTLPPREAVRIAVQALHGLEAIHRAGIVHRDISPENLMITPDGSVKIIDLGVAKFDDPNAVSQTRTGIFVGKLRYAAPEQLGFLPEGERVDGRTDLYALAMVVVELLTGRPPYEAKSPHEYFLHHAKEIPMTTVELPHELPGSMALQEVLQKALRRDRNERFASAAEFAGALETIEKTLPDPAITGTVALPLDPDATWRPSTGSSGSSVPSSSGAVQTVVTAEEPRKRGTEALPVADPAAATIRTPLPEGPAPAYRPPSPPPALSVIAMAPPPKKSSGALVAVLIIIFLCGAGALGAGAYFFWPKISGVIYGGSSTKKPDVADVRTVPSQPQPVKTSQAELSVTPQQTASSATPAPVITTAAAPTLTKEASNGTTSTPHHVAPPTEPQPQAQQQAQTETQPPSNYVDRPGRGRRNARSVDRLADELRGVTQVNLLAGSDQVMVYRTIHRYLPDLTFDADAPVTIKFGSTAQRLGYDSQGLGSTAVIEKNGHVIFRYNLPYGDRQAAADAFAQTLAEAFGQ